MSEQITNIDKNFTVPEEIKKDGVEFFNAESAPFKIYGIYKEDGLFRRMPQSVAEKVSESVATLSMHTAGGRVRFITDSANIYLNAKMPAIGKMPHFALTGSAGFDLYEKTTDRYIYRNTFVPPYAISSGFESRILLGERKLRDITVNFPLYSRVSDLFIGLDEGSQLLPAPDYANSKTIVYYGSSITQGGCASRPGNSYQAIVSRRFDCDYVNLGFSGSAKAEDAMIDYICGLKKDIFVYDYDHNAPDPEHLSNTHEKMFKAVRESDPELPIIIMSRPKYTLNHEEKCRLEIIKKTYENALKAGDKNVYLLTGKELMAIAKDDGTVDNCHPNDLGFYSMANTLGDLLERII